jgi:acetyl-CoA C-acetyltransferase
MVSVAAEEIAAGRFHAILLTGAECASTQRRLLARGERRDWSVPHKVEGGLEERGHDTHLEEDVSRHGAESPIAIYALLETARRLRMGLSCDAYARTMGELFAPFTRVAAGNPYAVSRQVWTAADLVTPSSENRMLCTPYRLRVVARAAVNQSAAVLVTSLAEARRMGVRRDRMVFLHGTACVEEQSLLHRRDLSRSPAAELAARRALQRAGVHITGVADGELCKHVQLFDLYSCFPIAVFNLADALYLLPSPHAPHLPSTPPSLTLTGGLPYMGGPGSNYSMHAIAAMVRALRAGDIRQRGLVYANGGWLSHAACGVYSRLPRVFQSARQSDDELQHIVRSWTRVKMAPPLPSQPITSDSHTAAAAPYLVHVESYTLDYTARPSPRLILVAMRSIDDDNHKEVRLMACSCACDAHRLPDAMLHAELRAGARALVCEVACGGGEGDAGELRVRRVVVRIE